jgi:hypothetical protein
LGDFIFKNERKYEQIRRNTMEKMKEIMKNVKYKEIKLGSYTLTHSF